MATPAHTLAASAALHAATPGTPAYYRSLAQFARSQTFRTESGHIDRDALDRRRLNIATKALINAKWARTLTAMRKIVREADESIARDDEVLIAEFMASNREIAAEYERKAAEMEAAGAQAVAP